MAMFNILACMHAHNDHSKALDVISLSRSHSEKYGFGLSSEIAVSDRMRMESLCTLWVFFPAALLINLLSGITLCNIIIVCFHNSLAVILSWMALLSTP